MNKFREQRHLRVRKAEVFAAVRKVDMEQFSKGAGELMDWEHGVQLLEGVKDTPEANIALLVS